jgi:hypothetical protein
MPSRILPRALRSLRRIIARHCCVRKHGKNMRKKLHRRRGFARDAALSVFLASFPASLGVLKLAGHATCRGYQTNDGRRSCCHCGGAASEHAVVWEPATRSGGGSGKGAAAQAQVLGEATTLLLQGREALTRHRALMWGYSLVTLAVDHWRCSLGQPPGEEVAAQRLASIAMAGPPQSQEAHLEAVLRGVIYADKAWFGLHYYARSSAPAALHPPGAPLWELGQAGVPSSVEYFTIATQYIARAGKVLLPNLSRHPPP